MPERLKNVDYANADRESIRELLELIQPLDMETEKYLEGVTDTQLHGLLKNDIENYIKIREIVASLVQGNLDKATTIEKFKEFTNTVQSMHFAENFEKFKEKTEYEFVRHENYDTLTDIAEKIERLKTQTEYFRASLKAREVLSKYGAKDTHFSSRRWSLMEGYDVVPLDEKQKAMENELKKAQNNVAYLNSASYKEEQEKAQKDIQQKRDIYNTVKTLNTQKDELQQTITDFSNRQKALQDGYATVTVELNQFALDMDNLAKKWEDFRLKWNLEFDVESDLRMKLEQVQAADKELADFQAQGGKEDELPEISVRRSKLNIELMDMLMNASYDAIFLDDFRNLVEQSNKLQVGHREKLLEQNRLEKDIESIKLEKDTMLEKENQIKQLDDEISKGLKSLGLKDGQKLTTELMEKIEDAFAKQEKEWSDATLEQKKLAAANVVKGIEDDMHELQGYNTYVQEHIMSRFENFHEHILDGSKDKNQKNSDEFEEMKASLAEFIKEKDKLTPEQYAEKVQQVKEFAEKYYAAKKAQIRLIPSTQRVVRMKYAQNLIKHCEFALEKQKYELVTKTSETRSMEAAYAEQEDRELQVQNRIAKLDKTAGYLNEISKDIYKPIAEGNFMYEFLDVYLSSKEQRKEEMVLPRMIGSLGAVGDEVEKQEFVDRFFNDYGQDKRTKPEDKTVVWNSFKQYAEAENNPEKMKELMENAINRIGKYIEKQPAELSEKQIVMGVFVKRFLKVCEHKNVSLSNETKNLANGITLLGKVSREALRAERALLTNKIDPKQSYTDVLKRYTAMKMLENRLLAGNGGKILDNLSQLGVAINSDEALDMITERVGNTKGFKDFKACSPKTRAYIISSQNEITSKLYGDISKQCAEVNKEVDKEVKIETPNVTTI